MKKAILILILLKSVILCVIAQLSDSIIIKVYDNKGRTDSVFIGTLPTATQGIDSILGEKDLLGTPYADLEIRSIQTTSDTLIIPCNKFSANHELKRDIRKSIYDIFLFRINAIDFPITVRLAKYATDNAEYYLWSVPNHSFEYFGYIPANNPYGYIDTLFVFHTKDEINLFYIRPFIIDQGCGGIGILINNANKIGLYPNPALNNLFVEAPDIKTGLIKISDISGRQIMAGTISNGVAELSVSNISQGYYLISIYQNNQIIYNSSFIKQ